MTGAALRSRWSLQLGTLLGIPIRVHATFVLLVVWLFAWASGEGQDLALWLGFFPLLLGCVLLHELGHALAARRYGVATREIVLYPIGGVARLEGMPRGMAELAIALAGPGVNLGIASLVGAAVAALGGQAEATTAGKLLVALLYANLVLFLFNLLPAFPMDGGRALRAFLSLVLPEDHATRLASGVSQVISLLLALAALLLPLPDLGLRLVLLLVAFFVLAGTNQELLVQRTRARVRGRTAKEAMMTRFETLRPQDSLEWAVRLLLATHQRDFPVIDAWGRTAGLLDRGSLMDGITRYGPGAAVLEAMDRDYPRVPADAPLEEVVEQLGGRSALLVLAGDELRGIVTSEKLGQLIEVLERLEKGGPRQD